MRALTRCIAFKHHGLHVVVEHFARDTTEVFEGMIMARNQRLDFHIRDEFDKANPAVTQCRAKRVKGVLAFAKLDPVNLHLLAWGGLKPYHRIHRSQRLQAAHKGAQLAQPTHVTTCNYLALQHCRRNPCRMGCGLARP